MQQITTLEIRGMSRSFGAVNAIEDFNLTIDGGTFVTLLGPSGCGKSTALNCLAGLLELTTGEIILNDMPIQDISAEKRGFGMVFQNYALFPHLNVTRNVSYGLEIRQMSPAERERRIKWALDLVHLDIDEFGHRYPAQLSGGQQQRLAIARTIVLEPQLLLLDEPLSNLDAKLRGEMRIEIKRLHKELGLTTVYVTHDQAEAMSLSDRVVVMRQGRIEQVGSPQEIYNCTNSLYVADFMGYANRIPVTLASREGEEWIVETEGGLTLSGTSTAEGSAGWQPGMHLLACSRPEDMFVDQTGLINQMKGDVRLVEYVGQAYESLVRLDNHDQTRLLVHSEAAPPLDTKITFTIRPNRLLLFPFEEQTNGRTTSRQAQG
jgi:putative spermidine/putrescine transport system ATP-binding protein